MKALPANPKILIIRMSSIGDVILTSPVVRQLREKYPAAQIDFVIRKPFASVMAHHPHISNLFIVDTGKEAESEQLHSDSPGISEILEQGPHPHPLSLKERGVKSSPLLQGEGDLEGEVRIPENVNVNHFSASPKIIHTSLKNLKAQIRHNNYDVILDLHHNFRSTYLYRFWGRLLILKVRKNALIRFLLVRFKVNLYPNGRRKPLSVVEKYLRSAAALGVDVSDQRLSLHLSAEAEKVGKEQWEKQRSDGFCIVMAPGAKHFTKRWPPDYYAKLIQKLYAKKGWRTILVGGPDEVKIIRQIQVSAGEEIARSVAGKLSLPETFALIKYADFFISNDSGLMHAAAAFQRPQIAIFGSTVRELGFFPINPNATVLENKVLSCRPCSHIGRNECPKGHFKCMQDISVDTVLNTCIQLTGK